MRHRDNLRPAAVALAALALAALGCSGVFDDEATITPSPLPAGTPTSVIALPSVEPTSGSPTPHAVVIATSVIAPTTVLGATMTPEPACTNDAKFVTDVTIPDGTSIVPGSTFDKTWQVKNTGTCPWDGSYHLIQVSDTSVQAVVKDIPLPPVQPGETVQLTVKASLSTDAPPGVKSAAIFELRNPLGVKFGTRLSIQVIAVLQGTEQGDTIGTIQGTVWHDFCHPGNAEAGGQPDGGDCVATAGGKAADGIFQPDEQGIAGIKVELHLTTCDGALVAVTSTSNKGTYSFTSLTDGPYCVTINSLDAANASILIPGSWTQPATSEGTATQTVTLEGGKASQKANFGWDFQFD